MKPEDAMKNLTPAYEGDLYTGKGDAGINFEGSASSFADENKTGLIYTMTLTNNEDSAVNRSLALCPGYFTSATQVKDSTGTAVDAIITEGTILGTQGGANRLIGAGKPKSIDEFLGFIKYNPTRMTGLKIQVDNSVQFDEMIYVKQNSPFRNLNDWQLYPNSYKDSMQNDDKRVEIPLDQYQMDNNTTVTTVIQAGRTVTYTWFVGAIKNQAYELAKKAEIARQNMGLSRGYGK